MNIRVKIKDSIMHYLCDEWSNHKRGKAHKENQALFDKERGFCCWNEIDLEMIMEKVVKGIYATDFAEYEKQIKINVLNEFAEYYLSTDCLHTDCPYVGECLDRCTPCLINEFKEKINGR